MRDGYAAEVGPAAEYFEGGIRINERCETSIPGLYAAGECSGGLFGANRVAAATTEMVVEGKIAGDEAARGALELEIFPLDEAQLGEIIDKQEELIARKKGDVSVFELRRRLRDISYDKMGVLRDGDTLTAAIAELEEVGQAGEGLSLTTKRRDHNREWIEAIELRNMVQCVRLSALAALERTESRGVHVREDHPFVDNQTWRRHLVVQKNKGHPVLVSAPVVSKTVLLLVRVPYEESIVRAAETLVGQRQEET